MQKSVRLLTSADLEIADTITMAAYNVPSSRIIELQRYLALQPDGWRLATLNGQAAAVGGAINYGDFSYVGLVGVLPSLQRHGLGAFLMNDLLKWAKQRGPTILLDASGEGVGLYQKLGFVEDDKPLFLSLTEMPTLPTPPLPFFSSPSKQDRRGGMEGQENLGYHPGNPTPSSPKTDPSPSLPMPASPMPNVSRKEPRHPEQVSLLQACEIPELVAFDCPYFGADRGRVFSRFLQEYPQRAFISRHSGQVTGYLFAQSRNLGPWVANTPDAAEQLLIHALALPFGTEIPNAILSPSNHEGLALLHRYGFRPKRQLSHMRLGPALHTRHRSQIYSQASFAIG